MIRKVISIKNVGRYDKRITPTVLPASGRTKLRKKTNGVRSSRNGNKYYVPEIPEGNKAEDFINKKDEQTTMDE